jgi:hypothetical protein
VLIITFHKPDTNATTGIKSEARSEVTFGTPGAEELRGTGIVPLWFTSYQLLSLSESHTLISGERGVVRCA